MFRKSQINFVKVFRRKGIRPPSLKGGLAVLNYPADDRYLLDLLELEVTTSDRIQIHDIQIRAAGTERLPRSATEPLNLSESQGKLCSSGAMPATKEEDCDIPATRSAIEVQGPQCNRPCP